MSSSDHPQYLECQSLPHQDTREHCHSLSCCGCTPVLRRLGPSPNPAQQAGVDPEFDVGKYIVFDDLCYRGNVKCSAELHGAICRLVVCHGSIVICRLF